MKQKMIRLLSLMLALVMLASLIVVPAGAEEKSYKDVPAGKWYAEAVAYVSAKGYMVGVTEEDFAPNKPVTRAMFVTILARMAHAELDDSRTVFDDVPAGKWYTGAVTWAAELGIVNGVSEGLFAPNKSITRQDLCTMVDRFVKAMDLKIVEAMPLTFTDEANISGYAQDAVRWSNAAGVIEGYEDETFRPKNTATRAQIATIIMRLDQMLGDQLSLMPAQHFDETDNGFRVIADAPAGALPRNSEMKVSRVTDEAALAAILAQTGGEMLAAADVTFYKDGVEVEPEKTVDVEILLPELKNAVNPSVYHIKADGTAEYVYGTTNTYSRGGEKSFKFQADSFSVYALVEGDDSHSTKTLTVEFYDGSSILNKQVVRLDQIDRYEAGADGYKPIFDPGVPTIGENQSFEGWLLNKSTYSDEDVPNGYDIEKLNKYIKDTYGTGGTASLTGTESQTIRMYAMKFNVHYLIYHDQAGAVVKTQSYHIAEGATTGTAAIEMNYVGFKGAQNFVGWVLEDFIEGKGDYPLYADNIAEATVYKYEQTYTFSEDMQFYPYLNSGHWLVFDTYKDQDADSTSTSFIPPAFYEEGENTVAPTKPTRTGYTFDGWYKDKNFTSRFVFGSPIIEPTTIYAKWSPNPTTYTVVFWQQKNTDTPTTADDKKSYDYYASVERSATTGQTVKIETATTGETADNRLAYNSDSSIGEMGYYFIYNETNSAPAVTGAVVNGDGTTVLNVYYDRKVITFNYGPSEMKYYAVSNPDWENGGNYYVKSGNSYLNAFYFSNYYYTEFTGNKNTGTTYYLIYNNTIYSYSYSYNYGWTFTVNGTRYTWSGTIYTRSTSAPSSSNVYEGREELTSVTTSISGLYGAQLKASDWPDCEDGKVWTSYDPGVNKPFEYPLALTEFVPTLQNGGTAIQQDFYSTEFGTNLIDVYYVGQALNGTDYTETLTEGVTTQGGNWFPTETVQGFTVVGYRFGTSGSWSECNRDTEIEVANDESRALYIAFIRNTHTLNFISNNSKITPDNLPSGIDLNAVPFGTSFVDFENCVPATGPEGYYFDGWYADPSCSTEFDFDASMPDNNVRIYAKWTKIRFRVVVEPRGDDLTIDPADIVIPHEQATTFRIDYGEAVEGANFNEATRQGYTLLGWYLDTDKTNDTVYDTQFTFSRAMTTQGNMADMTYGVQGQEETDEAYQARRSGVDPWKGNKAYNDEDGEHDDVVGKIVIYGRWREDPDGVIGVNVRYDAVEGEGHFSNNTVIRNDPDIYADGAEAYCQTASAPDNSDKQFLYWDILTPASEGSTELVSSGRKAYPGQTWDVLFSDAVEEAINSGNSSNSEYLTYPNTPAKTAEPNLTRGNTRAGTPTYQRVTTPTPGKFYLIAYVSGSNAYLMGTNYYDPNNSASPKVVSATVSNNQITGLYHDYQFGVQVNNSGNYRFGNFYYMQYLNIHYESGWLSSTGYLNYGNESYSNTSNTYWSYTNGTLVNANTSISNSYRYVRFNGNNDNNRRFELSGSGNASQIVFFELQEPEITGEEFKIATDLKVGDKYVIAIDNRAVGNEAVSGDYFINSVRVNHNTTGTESVIVDAVDVDSVIWQIESGNATDGYVLKNVANGKYLGMSADGQCYLSPSDTPLAWTYDDGTDLNNHVTDSNNANNGQYYYYLTYSTIYDDFTTSISNGNNVKFYKATNTFTVTFKDGRTGEVIKTEDVEEGGSATAPAAPDHTDTGWIFNGWDNAYDNVTADIIVTAQYINQSELSYTVVFHYMTAEGTWVDSDPQTVNHGDPATAPQLPDVSSLGYTFNSWDKKFDRVTSNLTINAVYKQTATKKYVVTLRAVYGRANTEAKTHIYWYANNGGTENNGAGVAQKDEGLDLNVGYNIPTPSSFRYQDANNQTQYGLTWEGRTFLGWAKISSDDPAGLVAKPHPELTEADLYLKWENNKFYVNVGTEAKAPDWREVTQVAADEEQPYEDLYAVWSKPDVFYVVHSATGVMEAINLPTADTSIGYSQATDMKGYANLTDLVTPGYIYGGYYSAYCGVEGDALLAAANDYYAVGVNSWTAAATPLTGVVASKTVTGLADAKIGTYDGSSKKYTETNEKFWNKTAAWATGMTGFPGQGDKMTPTRNAVYFLKEVPANYMTSRTAGVTNEKWGGGEIIDLYLLTCVDDNNYTSIGFTHGVKGSDQSFAATAALGKTFTLIQGDIDTVEVNPAKFGLNGGYIANFNCKTPYVDNHSEFTMHPTMNTLDGVTVYNDAVNYSFTNGNKDMKMEREFTGKDIFYLTVGDLWLDSNPVIRVYMFNDTNSAWATCTKVGNNLYKFVMPDGSWNKMIIVRCNPNNNDSNYWNTKWDQTQDYDLHTTDYTPGQYNYNWIKARDWGWSGGAIDWDLLAAAPSN